MKVDYDYKVVEDKRFVFDKKSFDNFSMYGDNDFQIPFQNLSKKLKTLQIECQKKKNIRDFLIHPKHRSKNDLLNPIQSAKETKSKESSTSRFRQSIFG